MTEAPAASPLSSPRQPGLSLVVPTFNRAALLVETLNAALAQSQPFQRIVVVDNGSTDDTVQRLAAFGDRIMLITTPNHGVQAARNTGVAATATEWVCFCDSDDLLQPDYVARVQAWLARPEAADLAALYVNFELFTSAGGFGDKLSRAPHDFFAGARRQGDWVFDIPALYERLMGFQPLFTAGMALRRSLFDALGGFNTALRGVPGEDFEFTLRVAAGGGVAYCTQPLARVRKHPGNDSGNTAQLNRGDAQVLRHAMQAHGRSPATQALLQRSVQQREQSAFDGFFASGDFAAAQALLQALPAQGAGRAQRLKRWICQLPPAVRGPLWRATQGLHPGLPAPAGEPGEVLVLEPAWDGLAHLPGNIGLLRVVAEAYPQARLHFAGGAEQLQLLRAQCPPELLGRTQLHAWAVNHDRDAGPREAAAAVRRLAALGDGLAQRADLLVFSSCTATSLHAVTVLGLAGKSASMLHGNASELGGWRSRNPLLRRYDLNGALPRYAAAGGRTLVLESRIQRALGEAYPWLKRSLATLPHPLLPEEAREPRALAGAPVRVGFLGIASAAKGFPEFVQLAQQVGAARPGVFEFRAIGRCAPECAALDQSALARPAQGAMPRDEFLAELEGLDFLFTWHNDAYYGNAASGVVYDAVNRCLPVIGRRRAQLQVWTDEGRPLGHVFDELADAVRWMQAVPLSELQQQYPQQGEALRALREELGFAPLAGRLRSIVQPVG